MILYLLNLNRSFSLGTVSNALLKSNIAKSDCCLESKFCIISCIVKINWLSHEWPLRNPCSNWDTYLIVFQMVKHVLTDDMFYSLATHTGQRYWTVVTGHVFVAFLKNRAYICISPVIW